MEKERLEVLRTGGVGKIERLVEESDLKMLLALFESTISIAEKNGYTRISENCEDFLDDFNRNYMQG